jgi:hypothetical protein
VNFFEALEGQRSENLATQTLLVILRSPAFRELQRLVYELLLRDGVLLCTEARRFRVSTQESVDRQGRPDLRIEGEDTLILLENKFSALFTPNQLPRYRAMIEQAGKRVGVLVLLCPHHKRTGYELDAVAQFAANGIQFPTFGELQNHLLTRSIRLVVLTWEELLRVIESGNFLISELASFIRDRFLVHVEFTTLEIRRIMSTEIPEMLQKIFTLVERVKGEIGGNGIETGRSSQSMRYFGFNLVKNGTSFYFGYMFDHWVKYGTPILIQTSPQWEPNQHLNEEFLLQSGFVKESDNEFLVPIQLQEGSADAILHDVVEQIQRAIDRVVG